MQSIGATSATAVADGIDLALQKAEGTFRSPRMAEAEFEFEGWFISYRMDIPNARRSEARALLRDFIAAAPLPVLPCERTAQGFTGTVKTGSAEDVRTAIAGGAKVNGRGADGFTDRKDGLAARMYPPLANIGVPWRRACR